MKISILSIKHLLNSPDLAHFFVDVSFEEDGNVGLNKATVSISLQKEDIKSFADIRPMAIKKAKEFLLTLKT